MIYLQLFISFFQVGLFSFGGGYASLPLIQDQVVTSHQWIDMETFTHLVTISQMTPGPIAINAATFVGTKVAGVFGAIIATIGCVTPSCIIVTLLAILYLRHQNANGFKTVLDTLRPATVAMIGSAGISILITAFWDSDAIIDFTRTNGLMVALFILCFIILRKTKWNPVLVMLLAGVIKLAFALVGIG